MTMQSLRSRTICSSLFLLSVSSAMLVLRVGAFSGQPQSSKNPVKVLVTGASGKTGRIVLSKLERDHRYEPKGLFRTERSARNIVKNDDTLCPLEHVVVADITSSTFLQDLSEGTIDENNDVDVDDDDRINNKDSSSDERSKSFDGNRRKSKSNGLENFEAMIICTSAVPRIRKRSLATMLVKAPWRALRGEPVMDVHSMRFAWKYGGYPQKVDYRGQIAQIDLAKQMGISHVILVSTMGGTDPQNFINSVGKTNTKSNEKEGNGDILLWKRKAEKYLVESGLDFTILHPGHLVDTPGGLEEFVLGVDDELYKLNDHKESSSSNNTTSKKNTKRSITRISREDVAELCVAALSAGKGKKTSFDCITVPPSAISSSLPQQKHKTIRRKSPFASRAFSSSPTSTVSAETATSDARISTMFEIADEVRKPAEEVLNDFLDLSITTNYDMVP